MPPLGGYFLKKQNLELMVYKITFSENNYSIFKIGVFL